MNESRSTADAARPGATRRLASAEVDEAARLILAGALVAFPTETVYGLGADATRGEAVAQIFAAKGRPRFNPLISHVVDAEAAERIGRFDAFASRLAERFWPGPLTLVVPARPGGPVSDLARAGLDSVALRVPAHPLAHALLEKVGRPVAAPSANRSGRVSPTRAEHVLLDLDGRIDAVLDGGETPVGLESTVVACLGGAPRLLRPGGATRQALEDALGCALEMREDGGAVRGPGMLASHYAPRARVRCDALEIAAGEAALLFGPVAPPGVEHAVAIVNLSPRADLTEAAARLFAGLRALDASGATTIAVAPVPETGLGEAINDRLRRAAAPR